MAKLRVGLTRDLLDAAGEPTFGRAAFRVLESDPRVEWEMLPELAAAIGPVELGRYDALYVNAPRIARESFAGGQVRTRIIARHGVGYDSVDIPACTEHGVMVTIQPDGVRRPVAVAALTFIFALSQKLFVKDRLTRAGRWAEKVDHMGTGLIGRTLGLIGAGNIGREIIRLAGPFGVEILAHDPYVDAGVIAAEGAQPADLETVLRRSDFVVVICLLTEETRHLIGAAELARMKPSAYLINVARGPIVEEAALISALREGRIAGAALDVFEQEPVDPNHPLLSMENVIVTPHALCWTDQCFSGIAESGFRSILAAFSGERPRGLVNPQVLANPILSEWLASNAAQP